MHHGPPLVQYMRVKCFKTPKMEQSSELYDLAMALDYLILLKKYSRSGKRMHIAVKRFHVAFALITDALLELTCVYR